MKNIKLLKIFNTTVYFFISLSLSFYAVIVSIYEDHHYDILNTNILIPEIPKEVSEDKTKTIEITTAGDCTLGTDPKFGYYGHFDWWFKNKAKNDYGYFFAKVKHLFQNDDYSYVNLEGTLTNYTEKSPKQFNFKGYPDYTSILLEGNIEGVNLANNHSYDYGSIGYNDTKKYLEYASIDYFGHDSILVKNIKGKNIAFVGFNLISPIVDSNEMIIKTIKGLKNNKNVDLIIANFHWGIEYSNSVNYAQRKKAQLAIDNGADIVIGGHSHCLQGIELYKNKYIVYSLGNFVFGGNASPKAIGRECLIVKMFFDYKDDKLENIRIKLIPCNISSIATRNNYQPIPVTGKEKQRYIDKINANSVNYKYVEKK